jgi:hypothetical protein
VSGGGTVVVSAIGRIIDQVNQTGYFGLYLQDAGKNWAVTNAGKISTQLNAIQAGAAGTYASAVTVTNSGLIQSSGFTAVRLYVNGTGQVTNTGTITGYGGVNISGQPGQGNRI